MEHGVTMGSGNAPVKLIAFVDFQCPFCASLHSELKALRKLYPDKVAVIFVHFPLAMHELAEPAARAAECAAEQGKFELMQDHLFEQQKSIGVISWKEFARSAGVGDLSAFDVCMGRPTPDRVRAGLEIGRGPFDVKGTPTIVINGWKLSKPPAPGELEEIVQAVLRGKPPIRETNEGLFGGLFKN